MKTRLAFTITAEVFNGYEDDIGFRLHRGVSDNTLAHLWWTGGPFNVSVEEAPRLEEDFFWAAERAVYATTDRLEDILRESE